MKIFGYKLVKIDEPPKRGNLKVECLLWIFLVFAVVLVVLGVYDFAAFRWFDAANAKSECFIRFSYEHFDILIAFIAMAFSYLSVIVTAKVNETMNLHSFNLRYGDSQMLTAVRTIGNVERRWFNLRTAGVAPAASPYDTPPEAEARTDRKNGKGRIAISNYNTYVNATERFKPWTEEEDKARRMVKNYFSSALELYRCGGISKKTLRVVCDIDAITLLFNVVEPMECIINEEYKFDVFYDLMKVVKNVYARKVKDAAAHKKTSHFKK